MRIHNVRLGFATNSSSTHSLIFLPKAQDNYNEGGFGWDNFTLASKEANLDFVAVLTGLTTKEEFLALGVAEEKIIPNLSELIKIIK